MTDISHVLTAAGSAILAFGAAFWAHRVLIGRLCEKLGALLQMPIPSSTETATAMMAPSIQAGATPELADALLHAVPAGALPAVSAAPAAKENSIMSWLSSALRYVGIPEQKITFFEGFQLVAPILEKKLAALGHTGETAAAIIDAVAQAQLEAGTVPAVPAPTP